MNPSSLDPFSTPWITPARLKANFRDALKIVPACMACAGVLPHPELPSFSYSHMTQFHTNPDHLHADFMPMRTIEYACMCALKWWGGGFSIHDSHYGKSGRHLVSTYPKNRVTGLGSHQVPYERIFDDLRPGEIVIGGAYDPRANIIDSDRTATTGYSRIDARQQAIAQAMRYARLDARKRGILSCDFDAVLANLEDLLAFHDELRDGARKATAALIVAGRR